MTTIASSIREIPITEIHADQEFNCRGAITPLEVVDLAESIRIKGLLQPVVVMEYEEALQKQTGYKYLLIAGYRRYTAKTSILRHQTIMANVQHQMDEADARAINLSENFQRKDLNLMQEATALKRLYELGLTEDQVGAKIGMSRGWVQIRFLILRLPEELHAEIAAGVFSQQQIRDLYTALKSRGQLKCLQVAEEFKKARSNGKSLRKNLNPAKKEYNAKRLRKRPEIFEMIEHMADALGMGLYTRGLAWAAGEISTLDLKTSIKDHDEQYGDGNYVIDLGEEDE